jgi:hypothetical protein
MLYGPITTPACVGADANSAATVTTTNPVRGFLYAVSLSHTGDDPDTTDIALTTQGTVGAPARTLLSRANSHADETLYPRADTNKNTDATALTTFTALMPIEDFVVLTVAQANLGDIWQAWLYIMDEA